MGIASHSINQIIVPHPLRWRIHLSEPKYFTFPSFYVLCSLQFDFKIASFCNFTSVLGRFFLLNLSNRSCFLQWTKRYVRLTIHRYCFHCLSKGVRSPLPDIKWWQKGSSKGHEQTPYLLVYFYQREFFHSQQTIDSNTYPNEGPQKLETSAMVLLSNSS